jgi:hypothetical protein
VISTTFPPNCRQPAYWSDALSPAEAGAASQTQDRGRRDGGFLAGRRHHGRPEGAVGTDAQRLRLGAHAADRRHAGRAGRSGSGNASLVRCPHAHCDQRIVGRTRSDPARHRSICEVGRRPPFDPAIGCDKYFLRLALNCAGLQRAIRTDDPCLRGGTGRPRGPLYACRSRWPRRSLGALVPFWAGRPSGPGSPLEAGRPSLQPAAMSDMAMTARNRAGRITVPFRSRLPPKAARASLAAVPGALPLIVRGGDSAHQSSIAHRPRSQSLEHRCCQPPHLDNSAETHEQRPACSTPHR